LTGPAAIVIICASDRENLCDHPLFTGYTAAGMIITAGLGHGPGSLAEACQKNARDAGVLAVTWRLGPDFTVRRHRGGLAGVGRFSRRRLFRGRFHRGQHRRRFRRLPEVFAIIARFASDHGDAAKHGRGCGGWEL
jgi:hypothetical protein